MNEAAALLAAWLRRRAAALAGRHVVCGDCIPVMAATPAESVDAVVCDPPYGLEFMGKDWDSMGHGSAQQAWHARWAVEAFRVLKPGGHLVAFGGTRTYHRLASALEDAGFAIRDSLNWAYGSGFPKSLNVSKAIDRAAGALQAESTRFSVAGVVPGAPMQGTAPSHGYVPPAPATDDAKQWEGWGSALKPGHEPIVLARKPLVGTLAANVLRHGTGALNIDACRVGTNPGYSYNADRNGTTFHGEQGNRIPQSAAKKGAPTIESTQGRWPPNVLLTHDARCRSLGVVRVKGSGAGAVKRASSADADGNTSAALGAESRPAGTPMINHVGADGLESVEVWECAVGCPVATLDAQSGASKSTGGRVGNKDGGGIYGGGKGLAGKYKPGDPGYGDTGGASRFFPQLNWDAAVDDPAVWPSFCYAAKAPRREREAGCADLPTRILARSDGAQAAENAGEDYTGGSQDIGLNRTSKVKNNHPTVKPVAVMRWLVRLVTPPGGTVLDPFCGSGTTGIAAHLEGFRFVGIEQDESYCAIAEARIAASAVAMPAALKYTSSASQLPVATEVPMSKTTRKRKPVSGVGAPNYLQIIEANARSADGAFWRVELGPMSALVGPTGTGKSTVMACAQLLYSGAADDIAFRARVRDRGLIFDDMAPLGSERLTIRGTWDNGATGLYDIERRADGSYGLTHDVPPGVSPGRSKGDVCPHLPVWPVLDALSAGGETAQAAFASWVLGSGVDDDDILTARRQALTDMRRSTGSEEVDAVSAAWEAAWEESQRIDGGVSAGRRLDLMEARLRQAVASANAKKQGADIAAEAVAQTAPLSQPASAEEVAKANVAVAAWETTLQQITAHEARAGETERYQQAVQQHAAWQQQAETTASALLQIAAALTQRRALQAQAAAVLEAALKTQTSAREAALAKRPPIDECVVVADASARMASTSGTATCLMGCNVHRPASEYQQVAAYYRSWPAPSTPGEDAAVAAAQATYEQASAQVAEAEKAEVTWTKHATHIRQALAVLAPIIAAAPETREAPTATRVVAEAALASARAYQEVLTQRNAAWEAAARADDVVDAIADDIDAAKRALTLLIAIRALLLSVRADAFAARVQEHVPASWAVVVDTEYRGRPFFRLRLGHGGLSGGQANIVVIAAAMALPGPGPRCYVGMDRLVDRDTFVAAAKTLSVRTGEQVLLCREDAPKRIAGWTVIDVTQIEHLGTRQAAATEPSEAPLPSEAPGEAPLPSA